MALGELDLIFEDSANQGLQESWFKEYMTGKNEEDIQNKFSSLGESWKQNKEKISETVSEFNDAVFNNFDLSVIGEKK